MGLVFHKEPKVNETKGLTASTNQKFNNYSMNPSFYIERETSIWTEQFIHSVKHKLMRRLMVLSQKFLQIINKTAKLQSIDHNSHNKLKEKKNQQQQLYCVKEINQQSGRKT